MSYTSQRLPLDDPLELVPRGLTKLYSIWVGITYPFASKGHNLSFHFTSHLYRRRALRISLGNSVCLNKDTWLIVATDDPTGEPVIVLEDNCNIGYGSMISAKNRIHLERDVLVGQQVLIADHNHAYEDITVPISRQGITEGGRIRIGHGTWIGRGSAILCPRGELTIGRNCVVAVNSVVTRSVPDYSLVWGNPATIIRQYNAATGSWRLGSNRNGAAGIPETPAADLSGT